MGEKSEKFSFSRGKSLESLKTLWYTFVAVATLGLIFSFKFPPEEIVLALNKHKSLFWDNGARILDFCASFLGYMIFFSAIFFIKKGFYNFLLCGGSFFLSSIIVQSCKRFFPHFMRPHSVMSLYGYFPDSLENNMSFPSGHTATAFVMAGIIFLLFQYKREKILGFSFAVLVFCSRIYMGMHFFRDTYVGMIIGLGSVILMKTFLLPMEIVFIKREKNLFKVYRRA